MYRKGVPAMRRRVAIAAWTFFCGLGACLAPGLRAQDAKPSGQSQSAVGVKAANQGKPTDYSDQAAVIEDLDTKIVFHDDGTSTMTRGGTVKIQSPAGVQEFGLMRFPYASATATARVVYVRVIKPDKSVVVTPTDNVLDMPAPITQQAPFYSDLKVLQVVVKGLEVGDTLEFETQTQVNKPLDPGQFWTSYSFMRDGVVLEEELEISVPAGRAVKVKSATVQPTIAGDGANRVYTWKTKHLEPATTKGPASGDDSKPADVQVTSFQSWDEVGKWFGGLAAPRALPTPEIQAKADELTRGAKTQAEKIQDLYAFVSLNFRYIGIDLGIGRYQPHAAADVLGNGYGDCKDKHTLFAALLAAEGVKAYPALISSGAKIDADVPSPAQFDHVITAIPQGSGFLFLDTTPEVGPFGYLVAVLRSKKALVIPDNGPAQLVETPADPPFQSYFHFQADGGLDSAGTLTSKMQMTFRDDSELVFRLAFRQAGQPQWTEVMQKISQNLGFAGTVSDVTVTPPDQTQTPLHIEYSYNRKDYGDWADKWIGPPFPPVFIPPAPEDAEAKTKPIKLGSPEESDYVATIRLPADVTPKLPAAVHLSAPFGNYDATYTYAFTVTGGVLHVERKLVTKEREVEPAQIEAYVEFVKAIEKDEKIDIYLGSGGGELSGSGGSTNPDAQKLYEQGREALQMRDFPGAIDYFQRAVEEDPKFGEAWTALGMLHSGTGARDQAISEFRKAIALDPQQTIPYEALGTLLMMQQRPDEALADWRELEKASPANVMAAERIGAILLDLKRYPEAVQELEGAVSRNPGNATLLTQLGTAYARSGSGAKAIATLESALRADSSDYNLNNVAYEMANANLSLTEALQDAQKAVSDEEAKTAKIDIDQADPEDFATASHLAAYWDTLGWAYFRTGSLENAEKYLEAGWQLSQDPTIADHLGQLYEKEGKKSEAKKAYESAVATRHAPEHAMSRLDAIGDKRAYDIMAGSLQYMREVEVPVSPKPKEHASADFVVLLSPGGKLLAKFVSGSEELRQDEKDLEAARFEFPFPDAGPVEILRRGILDCEPELPECSFAMYPLDGSAAVSQTMIMPAARPGQGSRVDPNSIVLTRRSGDSAGTRPSDAGRKTGSEAPTSTGRPAQH
jgi:tetratricopeptide (TPR) repeat protein